MTIVFFGERWDAPALDDARQVATPVGAPCWRCGEPVADGDRGFVQPGVKAAGAIEVLTVHRECHMADVAGHTVGLCVCSRPPGRTVREEALLVWEKIDRILETPDASDAPLTEDTEVVPCPSATGTPC